MRKILKTPRQKKTMKDVKYVSDLMQKYSSIEYAKEVAKQLAIRAQEILKNECDWMTEKLWKNFFFDQTYIRKIS